MGGSGRGRGLALAIGLALLLAPAPALAFPPFAGDVPCDARFETCTLCHVDRDGGTGCATPPCLNDFGDAFTGGRTWPDVAGLDTDGDGATNGQELGDPEGRFPGVAADCRCVSHPSDAASTPAGLDGDGDGVRCAADCDDEDRTVLECACAVAADCDDHDPCTIDLCSGGACAHGDRCGDGAVPPDGGMVAAGGGCACRAVPSRATPLGLFAFALACVARRRRL